MTINWDRADQDAALREGWDLFYCGDQDHESFLLSRLDDPGTLGYSEAAFADDTVAWTHVIERAANGSDLHNKALAFLAQESPGELIHIALWPAPDCPCTACKRERRTS